MKSYNTTRCPCRYHVVRGHLAARLSGCTALMRSCESLQKRRKSKKLVPQLGSRGGVTRVSRTGWTWRLGDSDLEWSCQNCLLWNYDKYTNQLKDRLRLQPEPRRRRPREGNRATKRGFDIPRQKMTMTFNLLAAPTFKKTCPKTIYLFGPAWLPMATVEHR